MNDLELILLETLSFFESFTMEELLIQMDKGRIEQFRGLTMEDMDKILQKMTKEKRLIRIKRGKECAWKRVLPPKRGRGGPWWEKWFRFLSG